jgi:hypothetical protein
MYFISCFFFLSILLTSFFFLSLFTFLSISFPWLMSSSSVFCLYFLFLLLLSRFLLYFFKSCSSLTISRSYPGSIFGSKRTRTVQLTPMNSPFAMPAIMHHACDSRLECVCFILTLQMLVHFGSQVWRYSVGIRFSFRRTSAKAISCSNNQYPL